MNPQRYAAGITGLGSYLPERILTNKEMESLVDTTDEWIQSRTGIKERRVAADDQFTIDLAYEAAKAALDDAKVTTDQVDLIIVATCTGDYRFPSTASLLQDRLGSTCAAFDLGAACSGFVYALNTAAQFVMAGTAQTVLVVGAEIMTRILNWNDRTTCVLFGDGAGAAVLQRVPEGYGILGTDMGSDGSGGELLKVECSLTRGDEGSRRYIEQNGREVYRFAVNKLGESALQALENCDIDPDKIDLFVPHQANVRIIDAAAKKLGLPLEKVFCDLEKYGNTSAASVPIALCEARQQNRIKHDDLIVMVGFGGGLTWASCVLKWYAPKQ
ncbi:MAG: beta-ketoacyl-ACP synthase III [Abditibacteriaceae bacterium]